MKSNKANTGISHPNNQQRLSCDSEHFVMVSLKSNFTALSREAGNIDHAGVAGDNTELLAPDLANFTGGRVAAACH